MKPTACLVLLLCVYGGDALKCYTCSYVEFSSDDTAGQAVADMMNAGAAATNNAECKDTGDEFAPASVVETTCAANEDQCTKNWVKMSGNFNPGTGAVPLTTESWTRGCQDSSDGDGDVGCTTDFDEILGYMTAAGSVPVTDPTGEVEVCACWDNDLCNSGPFTMASLTLVVVAMLGARLL